MSDVIITDYKEAENEMCLSKIFLLASTTQNKLSPIFHGWVCEASVSMFLLAQMMKVE